MVHICTHFLSWVQKMVYTQIFKILENDIDEKVNDTSEILENYIDERFNDISL